jgi:peroxiredoxin
MRAHSTNSRNSEKHLPSFVSLRKELKAAGAEVVACISGPFRAFYL